MPRDIMAAEFVALPHRLPLETAKETVKETVNERAVTSGRT